LPADKMRLSLNQRFATLGLFLVLAASSFAQAQNPNQAHDDKAEKIVQQAIQTIGGDRYLKVQTVIGRGFFTEFKDGVSGIPVKFIDYILYPDKERTEFTGGGARTIQTNFGGSGWVFDGAAKTIKDQTAEQIAEFNLAMRVGFENLLHGWWRGQEAKLSYVGRREAGIGRRNETVKLTYPDGFWIEYEFGATDNMPAKVHYLRKLKKPDGDEVEDVAEEDRLYKPVTIDGVLIPFIIDHFRAGIQTSRVNYESYELNKQLPDSLWTKPANLKAIK
jgi:hypothetical protein